MKLIAIEKEEIEHLEALMTAMNSLDENRKNLESTLRKIEIKLENDTYVDCKNTKEKLKKLEVFKVECVVYLKLLRSF